MDFDETLRTAFAITKSNQEDYIECHLIYYHSTMILLYISNQHPKYIH